MKHREQQNCVNEYRTGGTVFHPGYGLFTTGILVLAVITAVLLTCASWLLQAEPLSDQKPIPMLTLSEGTRNPEDALYMEGEVVTCEDMGLICQGISDFCGKVYDLPIGVYIIHVVPNTPAASLGILPGDILTRVNRRPLRSPNTLQDFLDNCPENGSITLDLYRKGKTFAVSYTPEDKEWN